MTRTAGRSPVRLPAAVAAGRCLSFQPHLTPAVVPGEGVYLISERGITLLSGEDVTALAPFLDGTRDAASLADACAGQLPAARVTSMISKLLDAELLTEWAPGTEAGHADAFWTIAGLDARALRGRPVAAVMLGTGDRAALEQALVMAGLDVAAGQDGSGHAELTVVACDRYTDPALEAIDAEHRATGRPWLLVRAASAAPWIGPVIEPGNGPCWHCLAANLRPGRPHEERLNRLLGQPLTPRAAGLPATYTAALNLAAVEAAKWLAGLRYPGQRGIWELDALALTSRPHEVRRRPQCPACGDRRLRARLAAAPVLPAGVTRAGSRTAEDQSASPQQLLSKFGHLADPVTGLVSAVLPDTRGPAFLNCYHAWHYLPAADVPGGAGQLAVSSGKGVTAAQAQAGALCEALERLSGCFTGDEPVVRASYRALRGEAVHPNAVQLFHHRQYADRARLNRASPPSHRVCDPFDERAEIGWSPVWSLAGERVLLPTALLYYGVRQPAGQRFCRADSNGAAAGGSLAQALLHGLYELIERDAVALWWYNRTAAPGIDLAGSGDGWIGELLQVHAGLGREVWALDLTSDIGVPVIAALSRLAGGPADDIVLGFGAHLDAETALLRALTEMNQVLAPIADAPAGRDGPDHAERSQPDLLWWRRLTVAELPYLLPDPSAPAAPHAGLPAGRGADPGSELEFVRSRLAARGLRILALNQTRPDIGLPVVKVIVPGLRPHWRRLAPGRLYDVPVTLGRLPAAQGYDDLNPIPLPV